MDHVPSSHHRPNDEHTPDEAPTSFGAWTLVWTLVAMKIVTIVVVVFASRQAEAGALFAVITWHWMIVLGALLAAPVIFRYRLRRVRARRDALLRSEWMVDEIAVPTGIHSGR